MGGWLALTQRGLSPLKKRQASLGALTARREPRGDSGKEPPEVTSAAGPTIPATGRRSRVGSTPRLVATSSVLLNPRSRPQTLWGLWGFTEWQFDGVF